ncbi:hypothetical protein K1T71_006466 [Dendrolimus kikuchii]|uniref:Uncharacterized protein n=1 Tax=Dendrolimus kikuchii TaxID=765133 RepID=A0ACC1D0Y8_9NEOP|nr:hypothetical protein K1T71_006466 [Dendrolimus kikuchii]
MALSRHLQPEFPAIELDHSLSKMTTIDLVGGILCHICQLILPNKKDYDSHYLNHNIDPKNIVYTCVVCNKQFIGYAIFRGHCYNLHVTKNKFKCTQCEKCFSKQSILLNHIKTEHNLECKVCHERFDARETLQFHENLHKKKKVQHTNTCNSCGKRILSAEMCEIHIDEMSTITFPCPICEQISLSKPDAIKHVDQHFNKTIAENVCNADQVEECNFSDDSSIDILGILCFYCDLIFKNRPDIELHFIEEHSDKPVVFTCNICQKIYDSDKYINFLNHCYVHLTKNKFKCTECDKTFPRLSLYIVHTEAFHSVSSSTECANRDEHKPFICWCCNHGFQSHSRLVTHLHREHGVSSILCPEDGCTKSFESLKDLVLHQREHNSISKNACRFCKLQFASLTSCVNHIDIHRIKNYGCPLCNKDYKEKYQLVKHITSHFECVLHVCKVCGKTFNAKHRLIEHNKIHNDVKKYACSHCGKTFLKPSTLQQHLNVHTGMRPYKCMVCLKTFVSEPNWRKHVRRMHNIDIKKDKIDVKDYQVDITPEKKKIENVTNVPAKTSSKIAMEITSIIESDESTMDSIASSTLEKEIEIIQNNIDTIDGDLSDLLLPIGATFIESEPTELQPLKPETYPTELGPDFVTMDADNPNGEFINLDENILPYIDPLLTIKYDKSQNDGANCNYTNIDNNIDLSNNIRIDNEVNWEPPVFTCLYPNLYRDEMTEANLLTLMKTETF